MKSIAAFFGLAVGLVACASNLPQTADFAKRAPASDEKADGAWSQAVKLKDQTYRYPGDMHHPRPADGWWYAPIHATLLNDGQVAISGWIRPKEKLCETGMGRTYGATFILNPDLIESDKSDILSIDPIAEDPRRPSDVLYCSGHAPLADGRVFYVGGATYLNLEVANKEREFGLNYARILDPAARKITQVKESSPGGPHPTALEQSKDWAWYGQGMMWYPTVLRVPKNQLLIAGGLARQTGPFDEPFQNRSMTFFSPELLDAGKNPWSVWVDDANADHSVDIRAFDYPHMWLLPKPVISSNGKKGQVAVWGGKQSSFALMTLDPLSKPTDRMWAAANGVRKNADGAIANGSDTTASLLGTGEIMMMGGGQFGDKEGQRIDLYDPVKDSWSSIDTGITRVRAASILLPDGQVLILSGELSWNNDSVGDRRRPTLFDPYARTFKNLAPWTNDVDDRGYHNLALLLSDGRILVGGGRTNVQAGDGAAYRIGCERSDLRIFTPPYLTSGVPRPQILEKAALDMVIGSHASVVHYDGVPLRQTRAVALMAMGSETHHFDQNQRYVPLRWVVKGKGELVIQSPHDELTAPAGNYFLYLISADGVPSKGQLVRLVKK